MATRTLGAVATGALAVGFSIVARAIVGHLEHHPDSPALNVVVTAIWPLGAAVLLYAIALERAGITGRWLLAALLVAVALPYGWVSDDDGVLVNVGLAGLLIVLGARALARPRGG